MIVPKAAHSLNLLGITDYIYHNLLKLKYTLHSRMAETVTLLPGDWKR